MDANKLTQKSQEALSDAQTKAVRYGHVEIDVEQNFGVEDVLHLRQYTDDGSNESLALSFSGITTVSHALSRHLRASAFVVVRNLQVLTSQKLVVDHDLTRHYETP